MQDRQQDMMATRRQRLSGEDRVAFDRYYGKPQSTRRRSEAGKGDASRITDKELYDAGYDASHGATPEIRAAALAEWKRLKRIKFGLDTEV